MAPDPVSLAGLSFFMPVLAFLLVFVLVYALLAKTKVLGEEKFVHLLISFILAVFFIIQVELVDFVQFSTAWFTVFLVCIFLILVLISFTHGKLDDLQKPWVAWVLVVALIVFFIISSAFTFNWAINWDLLWKNGAQSEWFGMVLLVVIAVVVSWVLSRKSK